MILVIDNYDSFTFNLVYALRSFGCEVPVYRNDALTVAHVRELRPTHIVISPGPGHPANSGLCPQLVRELAPEIPILGVCLGHQVIGMVYGGRIGRTADLRHGEASRVYHEEHPLFRGVRNPFAGGRYHSLVVEEDGLPAELAVTAYTSDGTVMGLTHRQYPLHGVQFHPESILTPEGPTILRNFLAGNGQ